MVRTYGIAQGTTWCSMVAKQEGIQKRRDACARMADPFCFTAEADIAV